jgi:RNA polymerase sigma factor for flagellar operon FliA
MNYDTESLILEHMELAKTIANREWRTATHVLRLDDMISLANLGLVDAANRWVPYCKDKGYDPSATQYFKVFAGFRIRGTIRDYLRKEDWATRTLRSKSKRLKEAGQDEGLTVHELADKTGMTVSEIDKVNARLANRPISLESFVGDKDNADSTFTAKGSQLREVIDTESAAFSSDILSTFVSTVKSLPVDQQLVIVLHYYKKLDLRKVAEELGLPEAKVSQMHHLSVLKVKSALTTAAVERG